ncbi:MAG: hypothetical protein ACK5PB_08420 [Pirellula sp.]
MHFRIIDAAWKSHNQVEHQNVLVQSATGAIFLVKITMQRTERSLWEQKLDHEKLFSSHPNAYIEKVSYLRKKSCEKRN